MIIINNASYSNVSVTYTADGTQREFSFPFDYLRKAFVKVEVNEEIILVQGTDYTVSDNKTVVLTEAPESGTIVRVFRETSTTRLVSWADASVLRAKDMTIQQVQNLHILEEQQYWVTENAIIRQGKEWNARNFPIKNVGDPVDPKDATNKEYVDNNFMKLDDNGDYWVGRGKTIRDIEEPIRQSDGATKNYVDHVLAGLSITGDRVQTFNSVALMKEAHLEPGMVAMTTGYHNPNDGGAGVYAIRTKTQSDVEDGGSIIFLDNGNVAALIPDGTVNVKQFGAKSDGVTDDTDVINACLNYASGKALVFIPDGTYLIDGNGADYDTPAETLGLIIKSNTKIFLNKNAVIKQKDAITVRSNMIAIHDCSNVEIYGGKLIGNMEYNQPADGEWNHGINISESDNIYIHDMEISQCWGDGIYIGQPFDAEVISRDCHNENIYVNNCYIHDVARNGIAIGDANVWKVTNCRFKNITQKLPKAAIDIEQEGNYSPVVQHSWVDDITVDNCSLALQIYSGTNKNYIRNVRKISGACNIEILSCGPTYLSNVGAETYVLLRVSNATVYADNVNCSLQSESYAKVYIDNSVVQNANQWQNSTININNSIVAMSIYTFNLDITLQNCIVKYLDENSEYLIAIADSCYNAVINNCVFELDHYKTYPVRLTNFQKVTVTNCSVLADFSEAGSFLNVDSNADKNVVNGNRYAPYTRIVVPGGAIATGCVNFK